MQTLENGGTPPWEVIIPVLFSPWGVCTHYGRVQAAQKKTEPGGFKRNPDLRPYGRAGLPKMAVSKQQAQTDNVTVKLDQNRLGTHNVSIRVIPCQITQYLGGFPHFVLDFLYMLTMCAKICLGNIFQVIASKV